MRSAPIHTVVPVASPSHTASAPTTAVYHPRPPMRSSTKSGPIGPTPPRAHPEIFCLTAGAAGGGCLPWSDGRDRARGLARPAIAPISESERRIQERPLIWPAPATRHRLQHLELSQVTSRRILPYTPPTRRWLTFSPEQWLNNSPKPPLRFGRGRSCDPARRFQEPESVKSFRGRFSPEMSDARLSTRQVKLLHSSARL